MHPHVKGYYLKNFLARSAPGLFLYGLWSSSMSVAMKPEPIHWLLPFICGFNRPFWFISIDFEQ